MDYAVRLILMSVLPFHALTELHAMYVYSHKNTVLQLN